MMEKTRRQEFFDKLIAVAAILFDVSEDDLRSKKGIQYHSECRYILMKIMKLHFPEITNSEICIHFGLIDHEAIRNGLIKFNDLKQYDEKYFSGYKVLYELSLGIHQELTIKMANQMWTAIMDWERNNFQMIQL